MTMRRLPSLGKITSKQMLLMGRREPYKPVTMDRRAIEDRTRLQDFEQRNAEGQTFVPDTALPPWRRSILTNAMKTQQSLNFRGLRLRAVDRQDEPGFPTHFR